MSKLWRSPNLWFLQRHHDYITKKFNFRIRYPFNGNPGISEIVVPARENHRPIDIAVDSINNYIYWADDFADSITRADLFGLDQTVILKDSNIQEIRGITLDNW